MVKNMQAVLLAAGSSRGSQTNTTKLLHTLCGQEVILYPLTLLQQLALPTTVVVGHQKDLVGELIKKKHSQVSFAYQVEQNGTADAVACTLDQLYADHVLIMNADVPLVSKEILEQLITSHHEHNATMSFVVAHNAEPSGYSYGRLIQSHDSMHIAASIDFKGDYHEHCLVDAGIYIVKREFLLATLPKVTLCHRTGETHIAELVGFASEHKEPITLTHAPFDRIRSIDTLQELWAAEHIKRSDLIKEWMSKGVRFTQPQTAHLDLGITIGKDSVIGAGVHLLGNTIIGKNCIIREFSTLENAIIHDNVILQPHSVISNAEIAKNSIIGPFAYVTQPKEKQSQEATTFIGALKTNDTTSYHNHS